MKMAICQITNLTGLAHTNSPEIRDLNTQKFSSYQVAGRYWFTEPTSEYTDLGPN